MNRRHFVAAALACTLAGVYGTPARSEPPVSDLMPADVKWKDSPFPGVQTAVISGDPTQPGLYVVRAKYGPGAKVMPHTHPDTRYGRPPVNGWDRRRRVRKMYPIRTRGLLYPAYTFQTA